VSTSANFRPWTVATHKDNGKLWEFVSWPFQDDHGKWKIMARFEPYDCTTMQEVNCEDFLVNNRGFFED